MARYGMLINTKKCIGCYACRVACQRQNNLLPTEDFIRYEEHEVGTYPNVRVETVPLQYMHCEDAPCVAVCPTGASYRDEETGIVLVNAEDCIGCESCLTGCPYGVRQLNPKTNTIEKCTLCFQRKNDENWVPACVHNCCCGARTFGDLDDPNSEAAKVVAAAGENAHYLFDPADLHPTTVYILSEKTAKWQEEPVEVTRYEKK